jgi:hypothetical protein
MGGDGWSPAADAVCVRTCPICGTCFDDHAYQLIVGKLGPFDSFACAEEAARKERTRVRPALPLDLIAIVRDRRRSVDVTQPTIDQPEQPRR